MLTSASFPLLTTSDESYDDARQAWNLAVDQRPAAVALPRTADEVAAAVNHARQAGLRVAPQGTGHNASALGDLGESLLLKTSGMRGVSLDIERRIARAEAGAIWDDVAVPASEAGFAVLSGSSHDVGIVGYSLGGGIGWLARKHGLATNSVTAIELVTAGGDLVRVDHDNEPELFWALRGGGGNFGVVTAIEFRMFELPLIYSGAMLFQVERAHEVLHAWREWTYDAPEEATTSARILNLPPLPDIPEPLRGRSWAVIDGAVLGSEDDARRVLAPLRELGPAIDMFAMQPPAALTKVHMDPPNPVPGMSEHAMLGSLPAEAVDAMVEVGTAPGTPVLMTEVRHLGGELGRTRPGSGALARMAGAYAMFTGGIAMPETVEPLSAALAETHRAFAPFDNGRLYGNFAESSVDSARFYDDGVHRRLKMVKCLVDPDGLFQANHQV